MKLSIFFYALIIQNAAAMMLHFPQQTFNHLHQNCSTTPLHACKRHPKHVFTEQEDQKLCELINTYGEKKWNLVSNEMPGRNPRQCRERWFHYLSPNLNRKPWTSEEDETLLQAYHELGPRWSKITKFFPNRSYTNIRNRGTRLLRHKRRTKSDANPQIFQRSLVALPTAKTQPTPLSQSIATTISSQNSKKLDEAEDQNSSQKSLQLHSTDIHNDENLEKDDLGFLKDPPSLLDKGFFDDNLNFDNFL